MPDQRFDHVHLTKGFRYCRTMIDRFSRWPEVVPLREITADTAFRTHWISRFGTPKVITTDQGTQFESRLFKIL